MEIVDLKMESMLKSCHNQDLIESVQDQIKIYHELRKKLGVFRDKKNVVLNSDLKKFKNTLTNAFTNVKLSLIQYKFMMVDECLNEVEGINRFYKKEEFSEYCKDIQAFAQKFNNRTHIFLLIKSKSVPPMLVCSQTESMVDKYYVHGWSETGRKLYKFSNKVEW